MQKSEQSEKKEDLRVRRSRKLLQEALIDLTVEKKGFNAVTVRDITERAMVNRSTFYRHFLDKYDLVEQYMDEVYQLTDVDEKVTVTLVRGEPALEIHAGWVNLLRHIQVHAEFYRIMLGVDGDPGFVERFRQNTEKRRWSMVAQRGKSGGVNTVPLEMRLKYVAHAGVGAVVWWLENGLPCSAEAMACWISQLSYPVWLGAGVGAVSSA